MVLHEQGEEGVVVPVGRQNGRLLCMCVYCTQHILNMQKDTERYSPARIKWGQK